MATLEIYRTDSLFANMSLITGLGSPMNIAGNYYNYNLSKTPNEADGLAIEQDWGVIGQDIAKAVQNYDEQINVK